MALHIRLSEAPSLWTGVLPGSPWQQLTTSQKEFIEQVFPRWSVPRASARESLKGGRCVSNLDLESIFRALTTVFRAMTKKACCDWFRMLVLLLVYCPREARRVCLHVQTTSAIPQSYSPPQKPWVVVGLCATFVSLGRLETYQSW